MVLEKGTGLELGKVPLQGPRQDTPDLQGGDRPEGDPSWGSGCASACFQPCPHHSPFPALGAGITGTLPSAPWDPWLHGALTVPGDSGLCNKAGCQVIHQEVSVSLERSPKHPPPQVSLGEGHTPRMDVQNKPAQRPLA